MRLHQILAVAAVSVANGVALLLASNPTVKAEQTQLKNATMHILQMHLEYPNMKKMPALNVKDPV